MSLPRSLPARPNLEYEQKEAKAFLRLLKAGDAGAFARAVTVHPAIARTPDGEVKLADAQLVLAREYGFTSWPKMVRYFDDLDRQRRGRRTPQHQPIARHVQVAQGLLRAHGKQRVWAGRALAAYAPRFYGRPLAEVFTMTPTIEEAYLVEARSQGEPSWESLKERPDIESGVIPSCSNELRAAIAAGDLAAVQRLVEAHPDILAYPDLAAANLWRIGRVLVHFDRRMERGRLTPIIEWLATRGFDYPRELGLQLCGHRNIGAEKVRWLLERGADPNWVAPSGIPALEHALLLYWNGGTVDILAKKATPRKALWIAAGLGDLDGVRRSLDAEGKPTPEATALRPPFDAVGGPPMFAHPEPEPEELLMEALWVAALNGRVEVLRYLASRGAPLDSLVWGSPLLNVAVGNAWVPVVETLLDCGASLDIRGHMPDSTPREVARDWFIEMPHDLDRRTIALLAGWDPDALLAGMPRGS